MLTEEVLAKYRFRRREDLEICLQALLARDATPIEQVGHKLKGNGVTFGYPELSELGEQLENLALAKDWGKMQASVKLLEKWVEEKVKEDPQSPAPNPADEAAW